jgi:hypothetical protein
VAEDRVDPVLVDEDLTDPDAGIDRSGRNGHPLERLACRPGGLNHRETPRRPGVHSTRQPPDPLQRSASIRGPDTRRDYMSVLPLGWVWPGPERELSA